MKKLYPRNPVIETYKTYIEANHNISWVELLHEILCKSKMKLRSDRISSDLLVGQTLDSEGAVGAE